MQKSLRTPADSDPPCDSFKATDILLQVQQRFYQFQDATSLLKQVGHSGDSNTIQTALNNFASFIDPNFTTFEFTTIGGTYSFSTITDIKNAYYYFATQLFNGLSQHFSTNVVVTHYNEYGDRLFKFKPGCGPYTLFFARQFPGATAEPTASSFDACSTSSNTTTTTS